MEEYNKSNGAIKLASLLSHAQSQSLIPIYLGTKADREPFCLISLSFIDFYSPEKK